MRQSTKKLICAQGVHNFVAVYGRWKVTDGGDGGRGACKIYKVKGCNFWGTGVIWTWDIHYRIKAFLDVWLQYQPGVFII